MHTENDATDAESTHGQGLVDQMRVTPTIGLEEAGRLLRCHPDTVRKMAKAGEIPGTKVGRAWVFYTERLLEWLDARCKAQETSRRIHDQTGGSALATRLAGQRQQRVAGLEHP